MRPFNLSMKPENYFELVLQALPSDIKSDDIYKSIDMEVYKKNQAQAFIQAFCDFPRINWQAYLECNQDVKKSGLNPAQHFLENGVYEGRKLKSWHPIYQKKDKKTPKVSIVVANRNNEIFLDKCLSSAAFQTLDDIEIIVVDDFSTDNSLALINGFAKKDSRFQVIAFEENLGTHMARKKGVEAATGDYVIFLDSDDFLAPNACEKAWLAVSKGYDMGIFNANLVGHGTMSEEEIVNAAKDLNRLPEGEYDNDSILMLIFEKNLLRLFVAFKIFLRELVQQAFKEMEDGHLTHSEDMYEFLVISSKVRNMIKIPEKLYNYSIGSGVSQRREYGVERFLQPGEKHPIPLMISYCKENGLEYCVKYIKQIHKQAAAKVLLGITSENANKYFQILNNEFGDIESVILLLRQFREAWNNITKKLIHYKKPLRKKDITHIGIYYPRISAGGIETTIYNLCRLLPARGIKISLFVQEAKDFEIKLDSSIKIYYLSPTDKSLNADILHLREFYHAVRDSRVDLILHMSVFSPMLVWHSVLLKLMNIPLIASIRLDHNHDMIMRRKYYAHRSLLNTLRTLDKITCLNKSTEIYLRTQGIDAEYIPNAIKKYDKPFSLEKDRNNILVVGRLHEKFKRIGQTIKILVEIKKAYQDVKIIYVGDFDDNNVKNAFYGQIDKRKLRNNIVVTGWTDDLDAYIDQCKLLLSTSYLEGFPNGIAEAQARGLPVVMYRLDIMMAQNNESIIQVPQHDFNAAAREIIRLLGDETERQRLAKIANAKAAEYPDALFADNMVNLLRSFDILSSYKYYSPADYNNVLKYMSFYAAKGLPT